MKLQLRTIARYKDEVAGKALTLMWEEAEPYFREETSCDTAVPFCKARYTVFLSWAYLHLEQQ